MNKKNPCRGSVCPWSLNQKIWPECEINSLGTFCIPERSYNAADLARPGHPGPALEEFLRKGLYEAQEGLNWLRRDPFDKIPPELTKVISLDFNCVPLKVFGQNLGEAGENVVRQTAELARILYEVSKEETDDKTRPLSRCKGFPGIVRMFRRQEKGKR